MKPSIHITKDNLSINGLTATQCLHLMASASLQVLRRAGDTPEAKEELYDFANTLFSFVLKEFAPEIEMRPDLTVEAILEAENAILDRQVEAT